MQVPVVDGVVRTRVVEKKLIWPLAHHLVLRVRVVPDLPSRGEIDADVLARDIDHRLRAQVHVRGFGHEQPADLVIDPQVCADAAPKHVAHEMRTVVVGIGAVASWADLGDVLADVGLKLLL